jgi:excisionase family DNA binding protein
MAAKRPRTRVSLSSNLTERLRHEGYLPISEVATRIGLHYTTVYRWVRENIVDFVDFGGAYYVKWASVVAHLGAVADVLDMDKELPDDPTGAANKNRQ